MPEPIDETRRTYDAITGVWADANAVADPDVLRDAGLLAGALPPGSLVVDIGCGPGHQMRLLREHGLRVVGLDLSMGQLRTGGLSGVAQADMRRLPLRAGAADAIWCQAALLHIPHRGVPAVLTEFARVVRAGGELFLNVAEGDGEGFEVAANYGSTRRRWFTFHRAAGLGELLAGAGFEAYRTRHVPSGRGWLWMHCRRFG